MLVGRRVEQDARVLRRPGGEHDDARLLHLLLFLARRNIRRRWRACRPRLVRTRVTVLSARTSAPAFRRIAEIGHHRIGERADRAADMAPAVIDAGRPALELGRVMPTAVGTKWMPLASAALSQTSPFGNVFIGGIG